MVYREHWHRYMKKLKYHPGTMLIDHTEESYGDLNGQISKLVADSFSLS